jgi:hypothetical protein
MDFSLLYHFDLSIPNNIPRPLLPLALSGDNFCQTTVPFRPFAKLLDIESACCKASFYTGQSSSSLARQPYVALAFLRSFDQLKYLAIVSDFVTRVFSRVGCEPHTQLSWRADVFCQGCLPSLTSPNFKASGSRFLPLHILAV